MKTLTPFIKSSIAAAILFVFNIIVSARLLAQEKAINVDVNTNGGGGGGGAWYTAWYVWVIGLALFVIILVAIISAGRKK